MGPNSEVHKGRFQRLLKAIDKRAEGVLFDLKHAPASEHHQIISAALYREVCRTEGRLRNWKRDA